MGNKLREGTTTGLIHSEKSSAPQKKAIQPTIIYSVPIQNQFVDFSDESSDDDWVDTSGSEVSKAVQHEEIFEIVDDSVPAPPPPSTGVRNKTRRRRKQTKEKLTTTDSSIDHIAITLPIASDSGKISTGNETNEKTDHFASHPVEFAPTIILPMEKETNEKSIHFASQPDETAHPTTSALESANFPIEDEGARLSQSDGGTIASSSTMHCARKVPEPSSEGEKAGGVMS